MLSTSIVKDYKNMFNGFKIFSAGRVKENKINLNHISSALRTALPALLLLSNLAFRGQPSYIGTTAGTITLMGTVLLDNKIGNKDDPAIFGLQVGTSLCLLASSLTQLGGTGLPFYLSLITTVANGAMLFSSKEGFAEMQSSRDGSSSVLHALFPMVWSGLMLSSQSSNGWAPAAAALAQPLILGLGLLVDYNGNNRRDSQDVASSVGWLCLGASLAGTVTSFMSLRESSGWIAPAAYGAALGFNLLTGVGALGLAGYIGKTTTA